jgi:hypothetical protein
MPDPTISKEKATESTLLVRAVKILPSHAVVD